MDPPLLVIIPFVNYILFFYLTNIKVFNIILLQMMPTGRHPRASKSLQIISIVS